jgi:hypothetical protein
MTAQFYVVVRFAGCGGRMSALAGSSASWLPSNTTAGLFRSAIVPTMRSTIASMEGSMCPPILRSAEVHSFLLLLRKFGCIIGFGSIALVSANLHGADPSVTNTAFFTGNITLDGDISDFFEVDGVTPKPGVAVADDPMGLDESPLESLATQSGQRHPSAFNQRRILSAYRPDLDGGTIFVGIDLPGGTGPDSSAKLLHAAPGNPNPNYADGIVGADYGGGPGKGRGKIVPFDADANGEADAIGRAAAGGVLFRCTDAVTGDTLDIVTCLTGSVGLSDNPRLASGEALGAVENYVVTVIFGNGQRVAAEFFQEGTTPPDIAELRVTSDPAADLGARVSTVTGSSGSVLGFDVEVAITNVNAAVPDLCARLRQLIVVDSGSSRDGSSQGEDENVLSALYVVGAGLEVTKQCPTNTIPPGGTFTFTGSVQNTGSVDLVNVVVVNDQPAPNTPVFGPVNLAAGEVQLFTNSYAVPANFPDCSITDTLTARGSSVCGDEVIGSVTATCLLSNQVSVALICPTNRVVPPLDVQSNLMPRICMKLAGNLPISFMKTTLSNVPPGYLVTDGDYLGWCVNLFANITVTRNVCYDPLLYVSTGSLPPSLQNPNWDRVNYILNHKQGSGKDIQGAIFQFIGGPVPPTDLNGFYPPSEVTSNIVADALANGAGFVPTAGQVVAVILDLGPGVELTIIEVKCPSTLALCVGDNSALCAVASGPGPFSYSWFKDNVPIPGQTNSCLSFTNAMLSDAGQYCVAVTSPCGLASACIQVSVTNQVSVALVCPTNAIVPPLDIQSNLMPRICMKIAGNLPISFMKTTLSNVPPGYVVTDGLYLGWCVNLFANITVSRNVCYDPLLYVSTGSLPPSLQNPNWDRVNYILNHKQGSGKDIQGAIFQFIGGPVPPTDLNGFYPPSEVTSNIVADALANGAGFVPTDGQVVAVILDLGPGVELTIIEVKCPSGVALCEGASTALCALASGPGPFSYSWLKDKVPIVGQTNSCLSFTNAMFSDTGQYCVTVTSPCGMASACTQLSVTNCPGPIGPFR